MDNKLLFCTSCDEERAFVKKQTEIIHEIKGESINVNVNIPYCAICGSQLTDLETENEHYDSALMIYRKTHNLLIPEEIKEIRQKYNLSQRAFARALGFAEATINRYELGALQDNLHNNLLLLCKEPDNFLTIINQNKTNLSQTEYDEIENHIKKLLKKKLETGIVESIKSNSVERLELMLFGLSKKVEDLEKKINTPFNNYYIERPISKPYTTNDRIKSLMFDNTIWTSALDNRRGVNS